MILNHRRNPDPERNKKNALARHSTLRCALRPEPKPEACVEESNFGRLCIDAPRFKSTFARRLEITTTVPPAVLSLRCGGAQPRRLVPQRRQPELRAIAGECRRRRGVHSHCGAGRLRENTAPLTMAMHPMLSMAILSVALLTTALYLLSPPARGHTAPRAQPAPRRRWPQACALWGLR